METECTTHCDIDNILKIVCKVFLGTCMLLLCSCSFEISTEVSPFKEVQITMCKNIEQEVPKEVGNTFNEADSQICAFVEAELEADVIEFFAEEEYIGFVFSWYHKDEEISTVLEVGTISSDGAVIANSCVMTNDYPFIIGEYSVVVEFGNIEIARQSFLVE